MHLNQYVSERTTLTENWKQYLDVIPAEWIKTLGLKKGDILSIENNDDNSITIFPASDKNSQTKEIAIHLSELSHDKLINQIYGAYLLGYDFIKIVGKTQIDFNNREIVKKSDAKFDWS